MTDDDEIKRLADFLRAKWTREIENPNRLDDEEKAIAARLLGSAAEAERLSRTKSGDRYRYRQPVITAKYQYVPPVETDRYFGSVVGDYWLIEIFKDGHKEKIQTENATCQNMVRDMTGKGIKVQFIQNDAPLHSPDATAQPSRRKAALDQIGRLRS